MSANNKEAQALRKTNVFPRTGRRAKRNRQTLAPNPNSPVSLSVPAVSAAITDRHC